MSWLQSWKTKCQLYCSFLFSKKSVIHSQLTKSSRFTGVVVKLGSGVFHSLVQLPQRRKIWEILLVSHQELSRRVRRWAHRRSQSSKNDFFDVCFPVSMADFHSLLSEASFSDEVLVMLNTFRSRFSTSRKRNFGRPMGRGALGSSLYRTCFGRRLSSIRHTWPAHRRRRCPMVVMRS